MDAEPGEPLDPSPFVLLLGRTREDRRRTLRDFQYLDPWSRPVFLYITSGRRKAELVRDAFAEHPSKPPVFLPEVVPWARWRDRLVRRFGDGRAVVDGVLRELLMGRVWRAVRPRAKTWGRLPDSGPVRRSLAELVERWGLAERGDAPMEGTVARSLRFPRERERGGPDPAVDPALREDASLLLNRWTGLLQASPGWTDLPTALRSTLRLLRERPPGLASSLRRYRSLIVDDLLGLPPLEEELLAEFVRAFREEVDGPVHLCLEGGIRDADPEAFFRRTQESDRSLRATLGLRRSWAVFLDVGARTRRADDEPHRPDLADLLADDGFVPAPSLQTIGGLRVRRYPGESREVLAIARAAKAAIAGGRRPEQLWVAFPKLDRYLPLVRDAFRAFGLPLAEDRGEPLVGSPPVSAALRLLRAADEGVDREVLRSVTGTGRLRFRPPLDAAAVEFLTRGAVPDDDEAGPLHTALREALARRTDGLERVPARMDRLYRAAVESGVDGGDPRAWPAGILAVRLRRTPREPEEWDALADLLLDAWAMGAFADRLRELGEAADVPEAAARFTSLLAEVGLGPPTEDEAGPAPKPEQEAVREAERFGRAALAELHAQVEVVVRAVEAVQQATLTWGGDFTADAPTAVREFREALEGAVRGAVFRPGDRRAGVRVVGVREVHGVDCPWLWVGGLLDGEFPRPRGAGGVLPPEVERLLPAPDPAEEDRAVFASLLRNAGHGARRSEAVLVLSAPDTVDGAAAVPSSLLQDLVDLRLEGGEPATLGELAARLQSEEEALLPPILSLKELLATPAEAARAAGAVPPLLREELERHRILARERSDPEGFGRFDGVLAADRPYRESATAWARALLRVVQGPDGEPRLPMHVSGLERYARCPMRFFFGSVLQSREVEAFEPDPPGRDEGILVHGVLEHLFRERIRAFESGDLPQAGLFGLGEAEAQALRTRARDLAHLLAPSLLGPGRGPWRDQLLARVTAGLVADDPRAGAWKGPLAAYLAEEVGREFLGLEPRRVEWRFDTLDPAALAARFDGGPPAGPSDVRLHLRGTVDRVDAAVSGVGRPIGGARLAVLDYKTGNLASASEQMERGLALQPLLYAAAALDREPEPDLRGVVAGYLFLDGRGSTARRSLAGDPEVLQAVQDARRASGQFVRRSLPLDGDKFAGMLRRAALHGSFAADAVFPPTLAGARLARCSHCEFRRACRVDHLRAAEVQRPRQGVESFWPAPLRFDDLKHEPGPEEPE